MNPRLLPALRRPSTVLAVIAALYVAAGGVIHLVEWLDLYRDIPTSVPGSAVVRLGFPAHVAASAALALALLVTAVRWRRWARVVAVAALAFEALALVGLVLSRVGNVFGWMEPGWTPGADQTRAVGVFALVALVLLVAGPLRQGGGRPHRSTPGATV